jgi:hypothetical protein
MSMQGVPASECLQKNCPAPSNVQVKEFARWYCKSRRGRLITEKMQEFGAEGNWSSKQCQKKWEEMSQAVQDATHTPMPQPIPVRAASIVSAPERWMHQDYDASASYQVSPLPAFTISPNPFANQHRRRRPHPHHLGTRCFVGSTLISRSCLTSTGIP